MNSLADASDQRRPKLTSISLLVLVLIFTVGPLLGLTIQNPDSAVGAYMREQRLALYATIIAVEWLVTGLAVWAVKHDGETLADLGFRHAGRPESNSPWVRALANSGIVAGFLVISYSVLAMVMIVLGKLGITYTPGEFKYLIPQTPVEQVAWVFASFTAGFCEETMFRGYAMLKLRALSDSPAMAAILSSVFFGLGHLYQGLGGIVLTGVYGLMFALLYLWRKQLKPGIYAHFINDAVAGLRTFGVRPQ
ncbi:MAG: CPBP family intramembrane glutamic endopeptidase [bacterium]